MLVAVVVAIDVTDWVANDVTDWVEIDVTDWIEVLTDVTVKTVGLNPAGNSVIK